MEICVSRQLQFNTLQLLASVVKYTSLTYTPKMCCSYKMAAVTTQTLKSDIYLAYYYYCDVQYCAKFII